MYPLKSAVDMFSLLIQLTVIQRLFYRGYFIWFPFTGKGHSPYAKYYIERVASAYDSKQYVQLIGSLLRKKAISTITHIQFIHDIQNKDMSIWKVIRKFGKPCRCISVPDIGNTKILVYKQNFGGYRVKSEFHFYGNKLFYMNYSFPYITDLEQSEIMDVILEKYLIPAQEAMNMLGNYIIDSQGYVISFRKDLIFSLNYYNTTSDFFTWLSQQRDNEVNNLINQSKRQQNALRNRL